MKKDLLLFVSTLVLAAFTFALMYPELFPVRKLSILFADDILDYFGMFAGTNFFYQGGIQLWDRHDQMSIAYICLTNGLFTFFSMVPALCYIICAPFFAHQADLHFYLFGFLWPLCNIFLKTAGSYLLLRRFTSSPWVLVIGVVYVSVVETPKMVFAGLSYQSLVPMLIHLILNIFERRRCKDFLLAALYLAVCFAFSILHGGYIYHGLHFMVLAALLWSVANDRRRPAFSFEAGDAARGLAAAGAAFVMLWPYAYMVRHCLADFTYETGNSRVKDIWSIGYYFQRDMNVGHMGDWPWQMVDYTCQQAWHFTGFMAVCFALLGAVMARDSRKYIFITAIAFIGLLNNPLHTPAGAAAHWVNVLTNPLKFMVRDFNQVMQDPLPYFLAVLAVMGIESARVSLGKLCLEGRRRFLVFLGLIVIFCAWAWASPLPAACRVYLAVVAGGAASVLTVMYGWRVGPWKAVLWGILILLAGGDVLAMDHYAKSFFYRDDVRSLKPDHIAQRPDLGTFQLNFQNPHLTVLRQHYAFYPNVFEYRYLSVQPLGMPGFHLGFTNMYRGFMVADSTKPLHAAQTYWFLNPRLQDDLMKDDRLMFISDAPAGVPVQGPGALVPAAEGGITYKQMLGQIPSGALLQEKDGMALYSFMLPADFPAYVGSTFLTADRQSMRVLVRQGEGARELEPAQGKLVRPWTFDAQNIRLRWATLALPRDNVPAGASFVLLYPQKPTQGLTGVWKNQWDNLGFDYAASRDGWFVLRYPYDQKWNITLDGKQQKFERVNESFIGFPIQAGEHKILLQYWPQTNLRLWLLISIILSEVVFIGVIVLAFQDAMKGDIEECQRSKTG